MRRREQTHTQARVPVNALQHRAGRSFAVRARDVDEPQSLLRIAHERGEPAGRLQTEARPKHLELVEKLDGFGIGHAGRCWRIGG